MLLDTSHISIDRLSAPDLSNRGISVSILRLDKLHPIVSGNKLFKLNYFLKEILDGNAPNRLLTFGGAYSNHLIATAYACKMFNIPSVGIVRGERPPTLSQTLKQCLEFGMELQFITRDLFNRKDSAEVPEMMKRIWGDCVIVPEGGHHALGAKGAAHINDYCPNDFTHICAAAGTATTIAGILSACSISQKAIVVPVLKGMTDIHERIMTVTTENINLTQLDIFDNYHFGGYAKKTKELIDFMNNIYEQHHIPTDFVYTAKMLYAVFDKIKQGYFPENSKIVCVHTGGLQGNNSQPKGTLIFE